MTEIMLDLETLGTGNEALILSIGACKFNDDEILDRFHVAIDPETCGALKMDAGTVMWWLDAERAEARAALLSHERIDIGSALMGFAMWATGEGNEEPVIWGNGSTFDNVILRSAYRLHGMQYPTRFWNDLCYRTVKQLRPEIKLERAGVHHDALDDAICQAKHLQAIRRSLSAPRDLLKKAAEQFRYYETNHRKKIDAFSLSRDAADTMSEQLDWDEKIADTVRKADDNAALAAEIEHALAVMA